MKTLVRNTARNISLYLVLSVATFLMLKMISEHLSLRPDSGFLEFKQDYVRIKLWRTAFYIHVFSSILTLMAGFTQFSNYILKEHRPLHRIMGRVYVIAVLFVNFPSGMILAFYANGHLPTKIAFIILDSLWFWFTLQAFLKIKQGDIKSHKQFMMRSYALTFSAITLRTWKIILSNSLMISPDTIYMIDAWMGFVPNLLLAEWMIRRRRNLMPGKIKITDNKIKQGG